MKTLFSLAVAATCSILSANATLSKTNFVDNDYVGEWGRLKLVNKQLSDQNGNAIQLKGWSTFSINYDEVLPCLTSDGFTAMKSWGANVVRLAIYPKNSKGSYSESTDALIKKYITMASDLKMYVLVDWHVLDGDENSGNPATYKDQAKGMFQRITSWVTSVGYSNVLYEICNECSGVTWDAIKSYANEVLPVIQSGDPGAIVIVGTPQWDQNINEAVSSPISASAYPNLGLMYAFHFYACSHMGLLGRLNSASASIPVFISEWGSVRFDGGGNEVCTDNSDQFLAYLQPSGNLGGKLISWCYWAWGQKNEASNCITNCSSAYTLSNLTTAGKYIVNILSNGNPDTVTHVSPEWAVQDIPAVGEEYGVLNVGWYDKGGAGISYYDANSSAYSDDAHEVANPNGTESKCCNAGAVYSGIADLTSCFRYNECVDVSHSTAGLASNWGEPGDGLGNVGTDLHNLCMTEPGEWMVYTVNVRTPGYYTVKCFTNSSTSSLGSIGMAIVQGTEENQNGNIIRSWANHTDKVALDEDPWTCFAINKTPSCGVAFDGSINELGAANGKPGEAHSCWGWTDCGSTASDKKDLTVLFKYAGKQKIMVSVSPDGSDSPGDFSNFAFTLKSTDIPDFEKEPRSVDNTVAEVSDYLLSPNPSNGNFTVRAAGQSKAEIFNMMGSKVMEFSFVDQAVVPSTLSHGVYAVRISNAAGSRTLKAEVK